MGEEKAGSSGRGQEFDGAERGGDAFAGQGHGGGEDYTAVGDQIKVMSIVGAGESFHGAVCEAKIGAFVAAYAEVHFVMLDVVVIAFDKPAAFLGGVGEGGVKRVRAGRGRCAR